MTAMSFFTLRLKLVLTCLLGLVLLGGGSVYLFSKAWLDLSRAYGLLTLNRKLELATDGVTALEKGDWSLDFKAGESPQWTKAPEGVVEAELPQVAEAVLARVRDTHLETGSLEVELLGEQKLRHFAVFRADAQSTRAVGSRAYRSLWDLSPWAAPFLGIFFFAFLVSVGIVVFISHRLGAFYTDIAAAMCQVAAGRLQNVDIPEASDPSTSVVTQSLRDMITILDQKERKIAQVSKLASEDSMTGLPNYRAFSTYMEGILSKADPKVDGVAVMTILDLDFFKKVNDTHGHPVGDFVLRTVAGIIRDNLKNPSTGAGSDFCGRYGGEEFVVIFANSPKDRVHEEALRVIQAIKAKPLVVPAEISETGAAYEIAVSASAGIAAWDGARYRNREQWVKEADKALYEAKRRGRARLVSLQPKLQEWL